MQVINAIMSVTVYLASPSPGTSSGIDCTFESSNLCGYTQDKSDNFDWTRKSGRTSSSGTGPSNDHTYGSTRGKSGCLVTWFIEICVLNV